MIAKLDEGIIPWHRPWSAISGSYNYTTGRAYSFMNQLFLGGKGGYITWKKAAELGWKPKGEMKGTGERCYQFFGTTFERKNADGTPVLDDNGKAEKFVHYTLKYYPIFSISLFKDANGNDIPEKEVKHFTEDDADENAEMVIANYLSKAGSELHFFNKTESEKAYYSPVTDEVHVPTIEQYKELSEYYSTCFHELTHSTGAKSRLNRTGVSGYNGFGTQTYSKEELVAEFGACILSGITGISNEKSFDNSAAYIESWKKHLTQNPDDLVSACTLAEKAVKMIADGLLNENMELLPIEKPAEEPAEAEKPERIDDAPNFKLPFKDAEGYYTIYGDFYKTHTVALFKSFMVRAEKYCTPESVEAFKTWVREPIKQDIEYYTSKKWEAEANERKKLLVIVDGEKKEKPVTYKLAIKSEKTGLDCYYREAKGNDLGNGLAIVRDKVEKLYKVIDIMTGLSAHTFYAKTIAEKECLIKKAKDPDFIKQVKESRKTNFYKQQSAAMSSRKDEFYAQAEFQ
jgi:antirestriction protein ArdC